LSELRAYAQEDLTTKITKDTKVSGKGGFETRAYNFVLFVSFVVKKEFTVANDFDRKQHCALKQSRKQHQETK
jgi:hypothetical protein